MISRLNWLNVYGDLINTENVFVTMKTITISIRLISKYLEKKLREKLHDYNIIYLNK